MRLVPVALTLACALSAPRVAAAYEREQHFGVALGGAAVGTDGAPARVGIDFGLHYTYGVSDALNLVAEAADTQLSARDPATGKKAVTPPQPGTVATGGVGMTYIFDVLRWVPYAGVLLGPSYFAGERVAHPFWAVDGQLAVGVDYELSRSWAVGVAYRQHFFLGKTGTYPEFTNVSLRFEYVWGW
jgi:opacity protein-like surface antigen